MAAYHIISEPVVFREKKAFSPLQLPALQRRIISAIRELDHDRWIIVSPGPGGMPNGYQNFVPPDAAHLIWGAHMYVPHKFTHQGIYGEPLGVVYPGWADGQYWDKQALRSAMQPLRSFQIEHSPLVFIGEFSAARWGKGGERYLFGFRVDLQ